MSDKKVTEFAARQAIEALTTAKWIIEKKISDYEDVIIGIRRKFQNGVYVCLYRNPRLKYRIFTAFFTDHAKKDIGYYGRKHRQPMSKILLSEKEIKTITKKEFTQQPKP